MNGIARYHAAIQPPPRPQYNSFTLRPTIPGAYGAASGIFEQAPPQYDGGAVNNDPTLAPGASRTVGGQSGSYTPPAGTVDPGFTWQVGRMPLAMHQKGWRSRRGPDGRMYWYPPGTLPQQDPATYHQLFAM